MKFYRLVASQAKGPKYPWSAGFGPLEAMPFVEAMPETMRSNMMRFWEVNASAPGMRIDPGGRIWSDFVGNGSSGPSFFVSEKLIEDLSSEGIEILRATEMPIASVKAKALLTVDTPRYFVLDAHPGLETSTRSLSPSEQRERLAANPDLGMSPIEWSCRLGSWNGADLCSPAHGRATMSLICTERIKDLAERQAWTNVRFVPFDRVA